MNRERVNVAIVGLGFGAEFIPIYQKHPCVDLYALCQRNAQRLQKIADAAGVDARFGDWSPNGTGDYLTLTAYRTGGATPTPAATLASPGASEYPSPNVTGSVAGSPFILGPDTVVTLAADGAGSFSGTDLNGGGLVKGTFTCG